MRRAWGCLAHTWLAIAGQVGYAGAASPEQKYKSDIAISHNPMEVKSDIPFYHVKYGPDHSQIVKVHWKGVTPREQVSEADQAKTLVKRTSTHEDCG